MSLISKRTEQAVLDLNIVDVLGNYNLELKRKGSSYSCCCPFHSERTPSFSVNPSKNICKCFSCGKGGGPVQFVMEYEHLDYRDAIIKLAEDNHIPIQYERDDRTDEQKAAAAKEAQERQDMLVALKVAQDFFVEQFKADNEEAAAARTYAYSRWGAEYCEKFGIGYAPKSGQVFINYLKSKGYDLNTFINVGLLGMDETNGNIYSSLRWRVTLPVRSRSNNAITFSARYMGDNPDMLKSTKYLNLKSSVVFNKSEELFGQNVAMSEAAGKGEMIVVEGGPDVMRMQIIGVKNTVAPLGTALTIEHLRKIKRVCRKIIFIPDSDTPKADSAHGAGVNAVIKSGLLATDFGFDVYVKEIPRTKKDDENEVKHDADSYITSMEIFDKLSAVPFVIWFTEKRLMESSTDADAAAIIAEVCSLMQNIHDENLREMYITRLRKMVGTASMWRSELKRAERRRSEATKAKKEPKEEIKSDVPKLLLDSMNRSGLTIKNGGYSTYDNDGNEILCSNFWFEPVLHIIAEKPIRIYRVHNNVGFTKVIEFTPSDIVTNKDFNKKLFGQGNFIWKGDAEALQCFQQHILEVTPSAEQIDVLGWDSENEFYSFSNGIFKDGKFYMVNSLGVVEIDKTSHYYLPAFSSLYPKSSLKFSFERRYRCNPQGATTLHDFVNQIVKVYGDGGMISFAWALASIFRDIVFRQFKSFPVLNLFGRKGSGKTELARAISSMFLTLPSSPDSCSNTTIPVIGYNISHCANAVYILDEFTNDLKPERIDILKGLWGGTARSKMEDGRPVAIEVASGVILAGQYKPEDEAIFSRCIHLMYSQTSFSREEKTEFNKLTEMVSHGNTHLLLPLLGLRDTFEKGFAQSYDLTINDVLVKLGNEKVEDRILKNWIVALAAFRVLEPHIDAPFTYNDLFDVVVKGILYQNDQSRKTSDTANFWQFLDAMHANGKIKDKAHFTIKLLSSFKPAKKKETRDFVEPKRIIYLLYKAVVPIFAQHLARQKFGTSLDTATMEQYLKSLPQYMGIAQHRFQILRNNGELEEEYKSDGGQTKKYVTGAPQNALCFDYDALKDLYDLSLETFRMTEEELNADIEEAEAPPKSASAPEPPVQAPPPTLFQEQNADPDLPF